MGTRFATAVFAAVVFGAALAGLAGCSKEDSHGSHSHAKPAAPEPAPAADEANVIQQQLPAYPLQTCVVSGEKLGGMGEAVNYVYKGRLVRFCCKGCVKDFEKDPAKYLKILDEAAAKAGSHK